MTEEAEKLNVLLQAEITERKRAEEALRAAKDRLATQALELERRTEKLRETVGELEAFSYSVAHDLRAPLRALHGYADCLLQEYSDKIDATGRLYLERMFRSSVRMDKLIQDVLSYTMVLGATVPLGRVALDTLVRDLIENSPDWGASKAEIQIEGTLPDVHGNEALLGQCISNLIGNAIKFVPPGAQAQIRISAESTPTDVRLWIKDNGIGIAPENHDRIFRMFDRIYSADEYVGTGIGLTIVRKDLERMGGRVGLQSELGKGSKFWIELPIETRDEQSNPFG